MIRIYLFLVLNSYLIWCKKNERTTLSLEGCGIYQAAGCPHPPGPMPSHLAPTAAVYPAGVSPPNTPKSKINREQELSKEHCEQIRKHVSCMRTSIAGCEKGYNDAKVTILGNLKPWIKELNMYCGGDNTMKKKEKKRTTPKPTARRRTVTPLLMADASDPRCQVQSHWTDCTRSASQKSFSSKKRDSSLKNNCRSKVGMISRCVQDNLNRNRCISPITQQSLMKRKSASLTFCNHSNQLTSTTLTIFSIIILFIFSSN
ncbi:hypothetical protein SNEBB_004380 [Seison nebaliae]|nr:hypothetical protein SNEBB_004380 [Seison nebaliae]